MPGHVHMLSQKLFKIRVYEVIIVAKNAVQQRVTDPQTLAVSKN